ncbi:MAG: hypothetical protein ACK532_20270 [Acidobacteriota bacterium]|jgi:hypothetical protein
MLFLRRLTVWFCETLCEATLITVFLTLLWWGEGEGRSSLSDSLGLIFVGTPFVFMVGSGYLITTALFGVVWRSPIAWVYPAVAAVLFVLHVRFFADGWTAETKIPVQVGGACIVAACTFVGNQLLRRWVQH